MKKSGFTLVELLAVIAILAILVIIALPNVLGMFNQAKKDTFTTETKEMVKIAQQQYLMTFGKQTRYATAGSKMFQMQILISFLVLPVLPYHQVNIAK